MSFIIDWEVKKERWGLYVGERESREITTTMPNEPRLWGSMKSNTSGTPFV